MISADWCAAKMALFVRVVCQIEREAAVASTERSEDGVNRVADTDNDEVERRKAAVERDKQQQREKISRWKVGCLLTYCGG